MPPKPKIRCPLCSWVVPARKILDEGPHEPWVGIAQGYGYGDLRWSRRSLSKPECRALAAKLREALRLVEGGDSG